MPKYIVTLVIETDRTVTKKHLATWLNEITTDAIIENIQKPHFFAGVTKARVRSVDLD